MVKVVMGLLVAVVLCVPVKAANLNWDFESYDLAPLAVDTVTGQDGWLTYWQYAAPVGLVYDSTTGTPLAGAKSARLGGQSVWHSIAGQTFADGVSLNWLQKVDTSWATMALNNSIGGGSTYATMLFNTDNGVYMRTTGGADVYSGIDFVYGNVYELGMVFDFTNAKYYGTVKDLTAGTAAESTSWFAMQTPTLAADAAGTLFYRQRVDGVLDNVAFVPEPASMLLLGLGGIAMFRRKA